MAILAFGASEADAFPAIRGATPPRPGARQGNRPNNKGTKAQGGPLDTAVKDLKEADKDLDAKKTSNASQMTRSAEQIVSQSARQANGKGGDKDRGKALDAVLKDIREAEKQIAARKPDDASTAIKSAISGLESLIAPGKKKKK